MSWLWKLLRLLLIGGTVAATPATAAPLSAEDSGELIGALIREIMRSEDLQSEDWREFSVVFTYQEDVSSVFGYAYDKAGEFTAIAPENGDIDDAAQRFVNFLQQNHDGKIVSLLVQYNRRSGRYNADFEYDDPQRWAITPDNLDAMTETLRPRLD